jgi:hypothetical protein
MNMELANNIEIIVKEFTSNYDNGNLFISCDLSLNGGNIQTILLKNIDDKDIGEIKYKNRMDIEGYSFDVLIEPVGFKHIEPYNRMTPYYLQLQYSDLNIETCDKFNVYPVKDIRCYSIYKTMNNFNFNSFWKYISFETIIKLENSQKFFASILSELKYPIKVNEILDIGFCKLSQQD